MYRLFKYIFYAITLAVSFLFLNISNNKQVLASDPGNPYNYSVDVVGGVFQDEEIDDYYYVSSDTLNLRLDQRIIDNEEILDIVILEYSHGDNPYIITRGSNAFKSEITYEMKNKDKSTLKQIQIILLSTYDVYENIPARWIATIKFNVYRVDPVTSGSFIAQSGSEMDENNLYSVRIVYAGSKDFKIKDIIYVDPYGGIGSLLGSTTQFKVIEGGVYTITIRDIFGNEDTNTVLVGYGRIDQVIISTQDNLIVTLGIPSSITFEVDLIGLGVSIINNIDPSIKIRWYVNNVLTSEGSLADGYRYFEYTPANNVKDDIRNHLIYATVVNKPSNTLVVQVVNNARPTIFLSGSDNITLQAKVDTYIEDGATANDDIDGDVTNNIVVDYTSFRIPGLTKVNLRDVEELNEEFASFANVVGTYYISYYVSDSHGNVSFLARRKVNVVDTIAPAIIILGDNPLEIEYGEEYIEYGAQAYDIYDGDVTNKIVINSYVIIDLVGQYQVIYSVSDKQGNSSTAIRIVNVVDNDAPLITLIGDSSITLEYKALYIELGARVEDNVDGILNIEPTQIFFLAEGNEEEVLVSKVDTSYLGVYYLTYAYADTSNNEGISVYRSVFVKDTTAPIITLLGNLYYPIIANINSNGYYDPGYTISDNYDVNVPVIITYSETIDTTQSGSYQVYFNAVDSHGNVAIQRVRYVIIIDTRPPIITLNDPLDITYEVFSVINAQDYNIGGIHGYIIEDEDVDLKATVEVYDLINEEVMLGCENVDPTFIFNCIRYDLVGSYRITYSAVDYSSNPSENNPVRKINIIDTKAPVIEIRGSLVIERPLRYSYNNLLNELRNDVVVIDQYDDYHYLPIQLEIIDFIDIRKIGTYKVIYNAKDSNGNTALTVERSVIIKDVEAPFIELVGESSYIIERGNAYVEEGAVAIDLYEGTINITNVCLEGWQELKSYIGCIVYTPSKPTGRARGEYTATYYAKDSSGNLAISVSRSISVIDTIAPSVEGFIEDKYYYNSDLFITFSALEGTDEVLTATLNGEIVTSPINISIENQYQLIVKDDFDNTFSIDFVLDKTAPLIQNIKDGDFLNSLYISIQANEEIDTYTFLYNNSQWVEVNSSIGQFSEEGSYQIRVRDLAENWSEIISFEIDRTLPVFDFYDVCDRCITDQNVSLIAEPYATIEVNGVLVDGNTYDFIEDDFYRVSISDRAGNKVEYQFTVNKPRLITLEDTAILTVSQHSVYENKVVLPQGDYSGGLGIVITYPKGENGFELVTARMLTEYEIEQLLLGDYTIIVPSNTKDTMIAAFIADEATIQALKPNANADLLQIGSILAVILLALIFILLVRRNKYYDEDDDEFEEVTIDDTTTIEE